MGMRRLFLDRNHRGFMLGVCGIQASVYLWGVSLYVPWRWWPTVQIGQIYKPRWPLFGTRRIGPLDRQVWGPGWYVCYHWPEWKERHEH